MPLELIDLFHGRLTRCGAHLELLDVDGRQLLSTMRTPFGWGPDCPIGLRQPLAAALLFHADVGYHCRASEFAPEAFAVAVVRQFPYPAFTITGDQVRAWFARYIILGRFDRGNDNQGSGRKARD